MQNRNILKIAIFVAFIAVSLFVGGLLPQAAFADGGVTLTFTPSITPEPTFTPLPTFIEPTTDPNVVIMSEPIFEPSPTPIPEPEGGINIGGWGYCVIFFIVIAWIGIIGIVVYRFYMRSREQIEG